MAFLRLRRGETRKKEERFILAIDGGGMRGIIPAWLLGRLSRELRSAGDERPLYSHFDLIAGTSTGALIAAALSLPTDGTGLKEERVPEIRVYKECLEKRFLRSITHRQLRGTIIPSSDPESFASFYIENGPRIFPQKGLNLLGQIFTDKYSASGYEGFLKALYGDKTMGDLMAPTVLLSYSTDSGTIYPISSWKNPEYYIWEGTRASSAAPLYFPVFIKEDSNGEKRHLIDGGIAANNPSLIAYSLARELYPSAETFHILSLSTGAPVHHSTQEAGGITGWGGQISKLFQNAQLQVSETVLPAIPGLDYTRIWAPVLERKIKLDETGKETMEMLSSAAERIYEEKHEELSRWVRMLTEAPVAERIRLRETRALALSSEQEGNGGSGV